MTILILTIIMLFSWPLSFFIVDTKVHKKSFSQSISTAIGILILSLFLIFILGDIIAIKFNKSLWIVYTYPIIWILLGVVFALMDISRQKKKKKTKL
jgi:hypothetical protein